MREYQEQFCPNCFEKYFTGKCPSCGYAALQQPENHLVLPQGVMLKDRYLVGRVLGMGGFGITYLAKDLNSGKRVAIKEYLPTMLAVRDKDSKYIYASSRENQETFAHGLDVFHKEAQVLRRFFGNPSVVQVEDSFDDLGSGYFVMEFLDGVNLKALAGSMGGRIPMDLAYEVLKSVTDTLLAVHKQGMLHRDVSPENIFITRSGQTKLIDFGATRFFVGEKSRSLSVILKPGFAPPEQYSSKGNQGPWTDIYALCATYYYILTGMKVPDAPSRLAGEELIRLKAVLPKMSEDMDEAISKGLALDYRMRQQTVEEFKKQIRPVTSYKDKTTSRKQPLLRGNPYVQLVKRGEPRDKWMIPKNMKMSIGRSSEQCHIILDDINISRVHCSIQFDDKMGVFYLFDLSSNGTYINNIRLERNKCYTLTPGEVFYLPGFETAVMTGVE